MENDCTLVHLWSVKEWAKWYLSLRIVLYLYIFVFLFQTRSLLGVFEKDAHLLRGFSTNLHKCCTRILNAQVRYYPTYYINAVCSTNIINQVIECQNNTNDNPIVTVSACLLIQQVHIPTLEFPTPVSPYPIAQMVGRSTRNQKVPVLTLVG